MKRFLVSSIVAPMLLTSPVRLEPERARVPAHPQFVGTWRLASLDGGGDRGRGAHPTGLLYYDATGHMAAQIAPDRSRPSWKPNTTPTPEQAKSAVTGYSAYFGTYTIDERAGTVTHHREAALNNYAADLVRKYEFDASGNRLTLVPLEAENAGIRLVWERLR